MGAPPHHAAAPLAESHQRNRNKESKAEGDREQYRYRDRARGRGTYGQSIEETRQCGPGQCRQEMGLAVGSGAFAFSYCTVVLLYRVQGFALSQYLARIQHQKQFGVYPNSTFKGHGHCSFSR